MPHTNRRKKTAPIKRLEVTGDDGWTRVTTTDSQRRGSKPTGCSASLLPRHETGWKTVPETRATVETVKQEYEKVREQWSTSDSCKTLASLLQEKVLPEDVDIDSCLIFGSGSFCGLRQGWISRKHSAMCQLAVLKGMQSTIEETSGVTLAIYAQDPAYNDVDVAFLKDLGVNVAQTPSGFDLVTSKSLAYTPGAEYQVEMEVIKREPAVLLTSKLNWWWRNEKGLACTNRTIVPVDERWTSLHQIAASEEGSLPHEVQRLRHDVVGDGLESDCRVLEDFTRTKQEAKLPSLDFRDNPFNDQHLYWSKPQEDGEDGRTQNAAK